MSAARRSGFVVTRRSRRSAKPCAYIGSNHDPEHVWDQALEHALGPQEWSEHYATDPEFPKTWTDAEIDRMAMVGMAFGAIAKIGIAAAHDLVRQDQLF